MENYIGKRYGKWIVIGIGEKGKDGTTRLICRCECEKEKTIALSELKRGRTKSCKSCATTGKKLAKNLTGKKFGTLTVIERTENKGKKVAWLCICDCGEYDTLTTHVLLHNVREEKCKHNKNSKFTSENKYIFEDSYIIGITEYGEEFYIDLDDYNKIKDYSWRFNFDGYIVTCGNPSLLMHRLIMDDEESESIDHINKVRHDNRKSNLRKCTQKENTRNRSVLDSNKSGVTGVYMSKGKWVAYITVDYKKIRLGTFINFKDAVKTRYEAELKYFGEFRNTSNDEYIMQILNS